MKKIIFYTLLITLSALSCKKEEKKSLMEVGEIKFTASYSEESKMATPQTKSTTPFILNNKATVFAFKNGDSPLSATMVSGTPLEVTAKNSGHLEPTTPLYLPKGSYDFYSVSLNNSSSPSITFANGKSGQLNNGNDYLWSKHTGIQAGGTVKFNYQHKAVMMEITVVAGVGLSNLNVTTIKLTPSKVEASSKMDLTTGEITPSTTKDIAQSMSLVSNRGSYIMLPMTSNSLDVEVSLNATIGATPVTGKKYRAQIPAKVYSGGNHYKLTLTATATALKFTNTEVKNWTIESISGITLIED